MRLFESAKKVEQLEADKLDLTAKLDAVQGELTAAAKENIELASQLSTIKARLDAVEADNLKLRGELSSAQDEAKQAKESASAKAAEAVNLTAGKATEPVKATAASEENPMAVLSNLSATDRVLRFREMRKSGAITAGFAPKY